MPSTNKPSSAKQRYSISLGTVQETLLIPVYARALETMRPNRLFNDPLSVEMLDCIEYDFDRFAKAKNVLNDVVMRTELLDTEIGRFISEYPTGQIINLGCGLDTRLKRLDNGSIHWVDLDMPDAIELRCKFIETTDRNRAIDRSMFDWDWFGQCFPVPPVQTLIVAEGLFMYFQPDQVQSLFSKLAEQFPGGQLIFQSTSPNFVGRKRQVPGVRETRATFGWGIEHGREVEAYDSRLKFLEEWYLIDRNRHRWGYLRHLTWLPPVREYVRRSMKFTRVRFSSR